MTWQPRLPAEIEVESFRRIEAQVGPHHLPPEVWFVVRRMIHTSADPEYLAAARLHPRAIAAGVEALRRGCERRLWRTQCPGQLRPPPLRQQPRGGPAPGGELPGF